MAFDTQSRTAWISQGFEHLVDAVKKTPNDVHFDVLIIGSGYGGAIAAATLAGRTSGGAALRVAVLERGNEYLPGAFPTGLAELPAHVRRDGNRQGLFDVRFGPKVTTVIANGLGGGSLINAGVMETPKPDRLHSGWPSELSDLSTWQEYYNRAAELVGARIAGTPNRIDDHPDGLPMKHQALRNVAPVGTFRSAEITVAMDDRTNGANVRLNKCLRCGDCATGCNFGAKESLDLGLLVQAHQAGAQIFSGGTVLHISKDGQNWIAEAVFTNNNLRLRDGSVTRIRAEKIIVAAGTLGSTEILMRSHAAGLPVSESRLGKQCSTNGDMLATDFDTQSVINNVANQNVRPSERHIGPTITGVIDLRDTKGVLIEEISVPAALSVAFSEVFGSVNTLHTLQDIDWSSHVTGFPDNDGYAVPPQAIKRSAVYAVMGDDGATGHIELDVTSMDFTKDGTAYLGWNDPEAATFEDGITELSTLTQNTGGRLIANPVWRLLPNELSFLTGGQKGPITTVHPLGGLVMADSGATGVVDPIGRVYVSDTSTDVHDGLVVLDGSIVPTALGTNPALTIAALALRSVEKLATTVWQFDAAPARAAPVAPFERPVFRETNHAIAPQPTVVEVIERLDGPVQLTLQGGQTADYVIELTLQFDPKAVQDLNPGLQGDGKLIVSSDISNPLTRSEIRVFEKSQWDELSREWNPPALRERKLDAIAKYRAPLRGTLKVLERESSRALGRIWRAGSAWLLNRGLRDVYQALFTNTTSSSGPGLLSRIKSGIAIASRSGGVRKLVYDLKIGPAMPGAEITLQSDRIVGIKTFTYNRRGNPWRQLMEVTLKTFPGLSGSAPSILHLDTAYLARIGVPLFRIKEQADSVSAIADLVGFFGYFTRLLLGIHIWSFRAPDERTPGQTIVFKPPAELPLSDGSTVPADEVFDGGKITPEVPAMASSKDPINGEVLITRYSNPNATKPPVVMFHGYSAGGTTFAHHAVNPNFASHLYESGREVLIADLRTSPYFAETTAIKPWSFEQIAEQDVKYVIDKALDLTGAQKVDIVAHCMGTIVVSKAILKSAEGNPPANALFHKIRRVAFTQVGPLVVFSPINILRGYIMRYLIEFIPEKLQYQFRPKNPTLLDDLWDRIVATLPYPVEEFDIENPIWPWKRTPWVQTRHRMDALYGRDFNATRIGQSVLDNIDEHFGALNLRTVASCLHYARNDLMTTYRGRNELVSRELFDRGWRDIDTFSVHGGENGLTDVATVSRMEKILHDAGIRYISPHIIEEAGHQDCLIGADRLNTFEHVRTFFDADLAPNTTVKNEERVAYPPWIGPIVTREVVADPLVEGNIIRIGAAPSHRRPEGAVLLRVHVSGDRILRPDNQMANWDEAYILDSMAVYKSPTNDLELERWDAFELPTPTAMPNHDSQSPGNATLVLIVYNESPMLASLIPTPYYRLERAAEGTERIVSFNRFGDRTGEANPKIISLEDFLSMRNAVHQILANRLGGINGDALRFRGLRDVDRLVIDPEKTIGVRNVKVSQLQFSPDEDFAEATLGSLKDTNTSLHDGIVPDRKPMIAADTTHFMFGSCQYPAGLLDTPVAYRSYEKVSQRLQGPDYGVPRFLVLVGDQVYVDPTAGLFDPRDKDDRYRIPYENWLRAGPVRTALRSAPSYMLLDDHEIEDNWEPIADPNDDDDKTLEAAVGAYRKFQHGLKADREQFSIDGFPFFMLDTRLQRKRRHIGELDQTELFEQEVLDRLSKFLDDNLGLKFVVTPSMFLPRHRRTIQHDNRLDPGNLNAIHSDGWDGYLATMKAVLTDIAKKRTKHVVFLSGDEHRACFTTANIYDDNGDHVTQFLSIHTSAMWAPYPFANGKDADIVDNETFEICDGTDHFTCTVNTERPEPGDGPTYISVHQQDSDWIVECEFSDDSKRAVTLI